MSNISDNFTLTLGRQFGSGGKRNCQKGGGHARN